MDIDQSIYNTAIEEGFSPTSAKLIVAQARYESGHYSSDVFKANNNMYGMKFVGQPLATRGTLAPPNERSESCKNGGTCVNSDHYAKYTSIQNSARDTIQRLYKKTRKGIGFEQLKNVANATEFANKLKTRDYFGFHSIDTEAGKQEARGYAKTLDSILLRIKVVNFYKRNANTINFTTLGIVVLGLTGIAYWYYKKKYK
jgi:hypothetical protein